MKKTLLVITALALTMSMMMPTLSAEEKDIMLISAPIDEIAVPVAKALPVCTYGKITEINDNKVTLKDDSSESTVVLNITDTTYKIDAVTGYPSYKDLKVGDSVAAYYGPAVTMSLPPQSTAIAIFANMPQDKGFPFYTQVEKVEKSDKGIIITTDNGNKLVTILKETNLRPYVTKNIIFAEQITVGSELVLWYDVVTASIPAQATADQVVVLSLGEEKAEKTKNVIDIDSKTGQITVDGDQVIADTAIVDNNATMIPLREVAEVLGFKVTWLNDTKTIQLNKNAIQATASIGNKSYSFSKMIVKLDITPILKDGKTYVPANFFDNVLICTVNIK